jgi:hypothetical protein
MKALESLFKPFTSDFFVAQETMKRTDGLDMCGPPNRSPAVKPADFHRLSALRLVATKRYERAGIPERGQWDGHNTF